MALPRRVERSTSIAGSDSPAKSVDARARDREWVARISTGDWSAFEAMFRAYKDDLGAFIEGYVQSHAVAEELVQELFLHLWDHRHTWSPTAPLNAYLFRAARNRSISHLRRERLEMKFRERLVEDPTLESLTTPLPGALDLLDAQDFESAVDRVVRELPDRCREIFVLNRHHYLTYAEVAEVLDISPKTVEVQMGRALAVLRRRLAAWLSQRDFR